MKRAEAVERLRDLASKIRDALDDEGGDAWADELERIADAYEYPEDDE